MAKQLADNRQSKSRASADTGMGVTQVVNADAFKARVLRYCAPRPVEVRARLLGIIASDDVGTDARKDCKDRHGRRIEHDALPARLAVRQ